MSEAKLSNVGIGNILLNAAGFATWTPAAAEAVGARARELLCPHPDARSVEPVPDEELWDILNDPNLKPFDRLRAAAEAQRKKAHPVGRAAIERDARFAAFGEVVDELGERAMVEKRFAHKSEDYRAGYGDAASEARSWAIFARTAAPKPAEPVPRNSLTRVFESLVGRLAEGDMEAIRVAYERDLSARVDEVLLAVQEPAEPPPATATPALDELQTYTYDGGSFWDEQDVRKAVAADTKALRERAERAEAETLGMKARKITPHPCPRCEKPCVCQCPGVEGEDCECAERDDERDTADAALESAKEEAEELREREKALKAELEAARAERDGYSSRCIDLGKIVNELRTNVARVTSDELGVSLSGKESAAEVTESLESAIAEMRTELEAARKKLKGLQPESCDHPGCVFPATQLVGFCEEHQWHPAQAQRTGLPAVGETVEAMACGRRVGKVARHLEHRTRFELEDGGVFQREDEGVTWRRIPAQVQAELPATVPLVESAVAERSSGLNGPWSVLLRPLGAHLWSRIWACTDEQAAAIARVLSTARMPAKEGT